MLVITGVYNSTAAVNSAFVSHKDENCNSRVTPANPEVVYDISNDPKYYPFGQTPYTFGFDGITVITNPNGNQVPVLLKHSQRGIYQSDYNIATENFSLLANGTNEIGSVTFHRVTPEYIQDMIKKYGGYSICDSRGALVVDQIKLIDKTFNYEDVIKSLIQSLVEFSSAEGFEGRVVIHKGCKVLAGEYVHCYGDCDWAPKFSDDYIQQTLSNKNRILRHSIKKDYRTEVLKAIPLPRPKVSSCRSFKVAIVDNFTEPLTCVNSKLGHYVPHGEFIKAILHAHIPNLEVVAFHQPYGHTLQDLLHQKVNFSNAFEELVKRINAEERFDAINFSMGNEADCNETQIKSHGIPGCSVEEVNKLLDLFTQISDANIPCFVAAGNESAYRWNTLLQLPGTIGVGALNILGEKAPYTCEINCQFWEQGDYPVKPVFNGDEIIGYSIFGDNKVDISIEQVIIGKITEKEHISPENIEIVCGTSYSTPKRIAKHLIPEIDV